MPPYVPPTVERLRERLAFVFETNPVTVSEVTIFGETTHVEERSYRAEALEIFEAGYYLLTGTTPQREGWVPRIFSEDEYDTLIDECCGGDFVLKTQVLGWCCLEGPEGLELIIRGDQPLSSVILTLAHESGHARQRILNPAQGTADNDTNTGAIREAEAFAFEVALVRALGEYTGVNVSRFPDRPAVRSFIDRWTVSLRDNIDDLTQEHDRGNHLLWLAVLIDQSLLELRSELEIYGILSSESLFRVHSRLVALSAVAIDSYVADLFEGSRDLENVIRGSISGRLDSSVPIEGFIAHDLRPVIVP